MILRRTGRYEEAKKQSGIIWKSGRAMTRHVVSFRSFKEDRTSSNVFSFSTKISTGDIVEHPVASLFSFGITHQPGVVGLGKTESLSDGVVICDSLGNSVLVFDANGDLLKRIQAEHPLRRCRSIPILYTFCAKTERSSTSTKTAPNPGTKSPVLFRRGSSRQQTHDCRQHRFKTNRRNRSRKNDGSLFLKPKETNVPFEPVSLSLYGRWLAVGDRNNGSISVVDTSTDYQLLASLNYPKVRDLCWSSWGELFALSEEGELSKISFAPLEKALIRTDIESGLRDAWALSEVKNSLLCFDVRLFRLWALEYGSDCRLRGFSVCLRSATIPGRRIIGFFHECHCQLSDDRPGRTMLS